MLTAPCLFPASSSSSVNEGVWLGPPTGLTCFVHNSYIIQILFSLGLLRPLFLFFTQSQHSKSWMDYHPSSHWSHCSTAGFVCLLFDITYIQRYRMINDFVRDLMFKNEDMQRLGFYCLSGNITMIRWMWVIFICVLLFLSMGSIWWCLILMPSMKLPLASTTGTPGQYRIYNYTTTTVQYENTKFKKFHTQTTTNNKRLPPKMKDAAHIDQKTTNYN